MAKKASSTSETRITITLTENQGDIAYIGNATIQRGNQAHVTQFEYFDLDDVSSAVAAALQQLAETHANLLPATAQPAAPEEPPAEDDDPPEVDPDTDTPAEHDDPPDDAQNDDEALPEEDSPKDEQQTLF
jgi:hypothetical protein